MLQIIFRGLSRIIQFLLKYSLGIRLLARIRRRDGLKWGLPSMLVAVPYFLVAGTCLQIIENGGSEVLYLFVLWSVIMGMAFLLTGPISVGLFVRARISEACQRRRLHHSKSVATSGF